MELSKKETQLQFKDQEHRELSDKIRELEAQLQGAHSVPSSSQVQSAVYGCSVIVVL